jgi:hypothetical protein
VLFDRLFAQLVANAVVKAALAALPKIQPSTICVRTSTLGTRWFAAKRLAGSTFCAASQPQNDSAF